MSDTKKFVKKEKVKKVKALDESTGKKRRVPITQTTIKGGKRVII